MTSQSQSQQWFYLTPFQAKCWYQRSTPCNTLHFLKYCLFLLLALLRLQTFFLSRVDWIERNNTNSESPIFWVTFIHSENVRRLYFSPSPEDMNDNFLNKNALKCNSLIEKKCLIVKFYLFSWNKNHQTTNQMCFKCHLSLY